MPIYRFFDPLTFGSELIYTAIILIFCLLMYSKTREIYNLTKHKGIQFFRYAFLFFGLAYASRLFLYMIIVSDGLMFEPFTRGRPMFQPILPVSNLVVAYFSTLAILYLTYSTIWKKINIEHFLIFSNIIALFVAVIAFVSRSPIIVSLIQLFLLLFTVIISVRKHKRGRKKSHVRALYLLISIFWLLNLFVLGPRRFLPFEIKVVFQIISVLVFIVIYYKVIKWVK